MPEDIKLTHRQLLAITCLLHSSSIEEAAQKGKVSRTTLYKWLRDQDFKEELALRRKEAIKDALDKLRCAIVGATEELVKLTKSSREDIRRLACKDIIEFALKSIELEEIEERLEKVEKAILESKTYR